MRKLVLVVATALCLFSVALAAVGLPAIDREIAFRGDKIYILDANIPAGVKVNVGSASAIVSLDDPNGPYFVVPNEARDGPQIVAYVGSGMLFPDLIENIEPNLQVLPERRGNSGPVFYISKQEQQNMALNELKTETAQSNRIPPPSKDLINEINESLNLDSNYKFLIPGFSIPNFRADMKGISLPIIVDPSTNKAKIPLIDRVGILDIPNMNNNTQLNSYGIVYSFKGISTANGAVLNLYGSRKPLEVTLPANSSPVGLLLPSAVGSNERVCGKYLHALNRSDVTSRVINRIISNGGYVDPSDTNYPAQSGLMIKLPNDQERYDMQYEQLKYSGVWDKNRKRNYKYYGAGVLIYVIDTNPNNEKYQYKTRYNNLEYKVQGHSSVIDFILGHQAQGVSPSAGIFNVEACQGNSCDMAKVVYGICQAASQASSRPVVINLSLHTPTASNLLKGAIQDATEAGAVVVSAYGNDDYCSQDSRDFCSAFPADWAQEVSSGSGSWMGPAITNLFSIAGYDAKNNKSSSYNRGSRGNRTLTVPNYSVPASFWIKNNSKEPNPYHGTSFAAPVVSGIFANWLSCGYDIRKGNPIRPGTETTLGGVTTVQTFINVKEALIYQMNLQTTMGANSQKTAYITVDNFLKTYCKYWKR